MDTRTSNPIHSALIIETGISSVKAQKALREAGIQPKTVPVFDPSILTEEFDLVLGYLPEEPNSKIMNALPFAEFLNQTLSSKPKKSANSQTIFVTSNTGFEPISEKLEKNAPVSEKTRTRVNQYSVFHSGWLLAQVSHSADEWEGALSTLKAQRSREFLFPDRLRLEAALQNQLRYGENPHQQAALYLFNSKQHAFGAAQAQQLQGKELSFNNLNDTDAAFELVSEFRTSPACAIIKHANPCGVAMGASLAEAYRKALACDPVSAFGGVIAFNQPLDGETAEEIARIFTEVVIAPGANSDARAIFSRKKNLRLLITGGLPDPKTNRLVFRSIAGGLLVQTRDNASVTEADLRIVTKRAPSTSEIADMIFAFTVAKHVKSNAIVYAKGLQTAGVGAGQMSRVDSARIAAMKARESAEAASLAIPLTKGSAAASDAFFPFADGLLAIIDAGATCVIQPGGSIRDDEVIKAADEAGLAMAFTGMRHFRH